MALSMIPKFARAALAGLVAAAVLTAPAAARSEGIVVFAAASLRNALDDIAAAWQRESGTKAAVSYAGSNVLARQIEAGAPADVFLSADLDWMDYAASKGLIDPASRTNLLGNALVLIAPKDEGADIALVPGVDLAAALKGGRLAMAGVEAVPAGRYGKAALQRLGAWEGVKDRIAQAENVRAALLFVARGEAPLGIVYRTDAASDPSVRVVATFPADAHPPILYPAALTRTARPEARAFLAFLGSPQARQAFERHGFSFRGKPVSGS